MKVLGRRVLIEQLMVEKQQAIILPGSAKNEEKYDVTFTVLQLGDECPKDATLKVGDKPIFGKYVDFNGVKVVEKSKEKEVLHVIVGYDDIIGIDD